MARYLPEHVTQLTGDPCQWRSCWCAVGAWLAAGLSGGSRTPSPEWFRRMAVKPGCTPGSLADIVRGLTNMGLWDRRVVYRHDVPRDDFRHLLLANTGKLVAVETAFDDWPDEATGGDFYHMLGVVCGTQRVHQGEVRAMDPLRTRYVWQDVSAVVDVALDYQHEHGEWQGIDCIIATPPLA